MNELTKRAVAALLSGLLVLGQAGPALAEIHFRHSS